MAASPPQISLKELEDAEDDGFAFRLGAGPGSPFARSSPLGDWQEDWPSQDEESDLCVGFVRECVHHITAAQCLFLLPKAYDGMVYSILGNA